MLKTDGNWFKRHKVLTVILAFIVLVIFINAVSPNKAKTTTTTTQPVATPAVKKTTLEEFYAKVQNGMTKEEVTAAYDGREASNCTASESEYLGSSEYCSYGGFTDRGSVSISYSNGTVSSKTKSMY